MDKKITITSGFIFQLGRYKKKPWQENFSNINYKYLIVLVVVITSTSLNYFYSIAMMFFTTFTLAYLTKGSRCK